MIEEIASHIPKAAQLELRKAWRLIHLEGRYKEGMEIIIELSGMPANRIEWRQPNTPEFE